MPIHPDHTSAAAEVWSSSGQDRTVLPPDHRRGPVRSGWSAGPRLSRTTQAPGPWGGACGGDSSHAGHHPSVVASGWGSPVSAARAAATSEMLARTFGGPHQLEPFSKRGMYRTVRRPSLISYPPVASLRNRSVTGHRRMRARPGGIILKDMSFNQLFADEPEPEIAGSAVILGEVHVGAGAILAQGLVVRAHGGAVSIGNHSAVLENGVVIGTPAHPVRVGQRTVFGHRAAIAGATVGDLCEIGNGAILMPGCRLGSGCILGEGTLVPPGTVIPAGSVLVGRPPHVIRPATDADRERLAMLRQHQTNLTDYPGTIVSGPMRAGERMGTLYAYRGTPRRPAPARCCSTRRRSPATWSSARTRSSAPA